MIVGLNFLISDTKRNEICVIVREREGPCNGQI